MGRTDLEGKTALITGGSRGLGLALARRLGERGVRVAITARGEKRLEQSCSLLSAEGCEAISITGDVGNLDDAKRMVDEAKKEFGGIDLLINNAGITMRGNFADLEPSVYKQVIDTNLLGSMHMTRFAIDDIRERAGSIVFISSIAGLLGLPGAAPYCASKMALTGLAESLRIELAPDKVHVGVVYLGFTEHDPEKRIITADGSPAPADRPAHHTQDQAAKIIVGMIARRKRAIAMTPVGKSTAAAKRLFPNLVEKAIIAAQKAQIGTFKEFK